MLRGSRPVLREAGGAIPPAYSTEVTDAEREKLVTAFLGFRPDTSTSPSTDLLFASTQKAVTGPVRARRDEVIARKLFESVMTGAMQQVGNTLTSSVKSSGEENRLLASVDRQTVFMTARGRKVLTGDAHVGAPREQLDGKRDPRFFAGVEAVNRLLLLANLVGLYGFGFRSWHIG